MPRRSTGNYKLRSSVRIAKGEDDIPPLEACSPDKAAVKIKQEKKGEKRRVKTDLRKLSAKKLKTVKKLDQPQPKSLTFKPSPSRKEKKPSSSRSVRKVKKSNNSTKIKTDPLPNFKKPSSQACYAAHEILVELYGKPTRVKSFERDGWSLLDSLCRTILSQNTTDKTSARAFATLKMTLPTWKEVLNAPPGIAEEAIRCGGLADVKMHRIRLILTAILERFESECSDGEPNLDFLSDWPTDKVKKYLLGFKGVGPKTVSCLLMFAMGRNEFPVDTHVWKIAQKLGWIPKGASREVAYTHLNNRIPNKIKYDLHVLLVQHGKKLKNALGALSKISSSPKFKLIKSAA